MKRLFVSLLVTLILYIIYVDLSIGTIPNTTNETIESIEVDSKVNQIDETVLVTFSKTVEQGDTVLSIIESQLKGSIPVPIEKVVNDFIILNKGKKPEEIQAGKSYLFPDYSKSDSN